MADTSRAAARMWEASCFSATLVGTGGHLEGIVTERNLTAKVLAAGLGPDETRLESIMISVPVVLAPDQRSRLTALAILPIGRALQTWR